MQVILLNYKISNSCNRCNSEEFYFSFSLFIFFLYIVCCNHVFNISFEEAERESISAIYYLQKIYHSQGLINFKAAVRHEKINQCLTDSFQCLTNICKI